MFIHNKHTCQTTIEQTKPNKRPMGHIPHLRNISKQKNNLMFIEAGILKIAITVSFLEK